MNKTEQVRFISNYLAEAWRELAEYLLQHPEKLTNFGNEKLAKKFTFYSRQLIDAMSPTNFIATNPEILSKTIETNGQNLIEGFNKFRKDLENGTGHFNFYQENHTQFELGKNIACTKGNVIYENDLMQLIQYHPITEKIYSNPILIIPPWINKYYISDLQEENSFVKWLINQGHIVFMISWVNPTVKHKDKTFSDYLFEGPLTAIKMIQEITNYAKINLLGYCIGGTLLGCLLAYLARKKNNISISSATFLTTLFDFSDLGEIGVFIDERQIKLIEESMQEKGYLHGSIMATTFNILRAHDLIWTTFVNNYLKGQEPKPFDLLYWNADSTNIPEPTHRFYLRNLCLENHLIKPGKIIIDDIPLHLNDITLPCYFLAAEKDHIVPWQSACQSKNYLGKMPKFVLAGSGHVAGVINPPKNNKYGYWTNQTKLLDADSFLKTAIFHEGSWWNDWNQWIKKYSGKLISTNNLNINPNSIIEKAPGSYVKVRISITDNSLCY